MSVIVTTPDDLRAIVAEAVRDALAAREPEPEWLDAGEVAARLGCSPKTARRLGIPCRTFGPRLTRWRAADVDAFVTKRGAR